MLEKPKPEAVEEENCDKSSSSKDQNDSRYYYDDAHGYEIYVEEETELDEDEDPKKLNAPIIS